MTKSKGIKKTPQKGKTYTGGKEPRTFDLFRSTPVAFYEIDTDLINETTDPSKSTKSLRAMYSQLRSIAQKRLDRMKGHPEAAATLARHPDGFKKLSSIKDRRALVYELISVSNFLTAKTGSLQGIRKVNETRAEKLNKTFADRGIDFKLKPEEMADFGFLINLMKKAFGLETGKYSLDYIVEVWDDLHTKGVFDRKSIAAAMEKVRAEMLEEGETERTKKVTPSAIRSFFHSSGLPKRHNTSKGKKGKKK